MVTDHEHDADFGASCPLPEPPKVLRMPEELTEALDAFLAANMPEYSTADYIAIQVESVEHAHDELNGAYHRSARFFLVDHASEVAADNDNPEEAAE